MWPTGEHLLEALDDTLTKLAKRPGYKIRLEVEFRGRWIFDQKITYLPKFFVEEGRMTVWDGRNKLVYCSPAPVAGKYYYD